MVLRDGETAKYLPSAELEVSQTTNIHQPLRGCKSIEKGLMNRD